MLLRTLSLTLLAGLLLAGCAPSVDLAAEEEAVRAVSARWLELANEQDAAGIAALFAQDGIMYAEGQPPLVGPEAIEADISQYYAENPGLEANFGTDRIEVAASGDLAVEHGSWNEIDRQGRYLTIYRKVGNVWKVAADMSHSTDPDGGAPGWARADLARWYDRFNARDAAGLADYYTADARVGDARGRAAIIAFFEAEWAENNPTCSGGFEDFVVIKNIAAGWGRDTCIVTPPDGGPTTTVHSKWLAFYEQQADGTWLCSRDRAEAVGP